MAKRGINVTFLADVRDFLRGAGKAEDALDDVSDALDDVARDGDKATQKLERDFRDLANSSERSFDQIARDAKQSFGKVRQSADTSLPAKGQSRASELGTEVGAEFGQNIGEGISSQATGIAGATDLALGTVGGLLPALGPVGAAVGVGALFVGSIVRGVSAAAAEQKARIAALVEQSLSGAVSKAEETGQSVALAYLRGQSSAFEQAEQIASLLGLDDTNAALARLGELARDSGVQVGDALLAVGGAGQAAVGAQAKVERQLLANLEAYRRLQRTAEDQVQTEGKVATETQRSLDALLLATEAGEDLLGYTRQNREAVALTVAAAQTLDQATRDQTAPAQKNAEYARQSADAAERQAAALGDTARYIEDARRAAASRDWAAWEQALRRGGTAAGTIRAELSEVPR